MSSDFLLPQLSGRLAHLIGQVVIARDCEKLLEKGVRVRERRELTGGEDPVGLRGLTTFIYQIKIF